jgi:hypothetical protein
MATRKKGKTTNEINNLGPIEHAVYDFVDGVNVLNGPNGVGKSISIEALRQALGAPPTMELTPRDGTDKGTMSINGVTVLVVTGRNRQTGKIEIGLASTSPLSDLVEPGLKDKAAAEKKRIQALLQLVNAQVTEDIISMLVDGDHDALHYVERKEGFVRLQGLDLVTAADRVRRTVHKFKQEFELEAARADGEIKAHQAPKPARLESKPVAEAEKSYRESERQLATIEGEARQRERQEKEREEIRQTLGERPDVSGAHNKAALCLTHCEAIKGQIAELEKSLAVAQAALQTEEGNYRSLLADEESAKATAASWDRRKAILDSEIEGATTKDVEFCQKRVAAARETLEAARATEAYNQALIAQGDATKRKESALNEAERLEKLAVGVPGRLGAVLQGLGLPGITIHEAGKGRERYDELCVVHESGEIEPAWRLSYGERCKLGLDLLISQNNNSVVPISWEFWNSLSPAKQKETAQLLIERGLQGVTERPADTPLAVETVSE